MNAAKFENLLLVVG